MTGRRDGAVTGARTGTVFTVRDPALGEFALRPVDPEADAGLLHGWVTHPKAAFWMMQDATRADVVREFAGFAARSDYDAFIGLHDGRPAFLVERYDPAGELAGVYPVRRGDVGMHFLVAPAGEPIRGFTRAVIRSVMAFLFSDPRTTRVVVEPDARNTAVHRLNATVGFQVVGTVSLPTKEALLSMCTREQYEAAVRRTGPDRPSPQEHPMQEHPTQEHPTHPMPDPRAVVAHLTPDRWEQAGRLLVRKALAEFTHERLLTPRPLDDGRYAVRSDDGTVEYRFAADLLPLNHWRVDAASITRHRLPSGRSLPLDALDLVIELRDALRLSDTVLPVYLEEISSTLSSTAFKLSGRAVSAHELADAGFQAIETGMTEGHPCFVANNGRIGFNSAEYRSYAPEAGAPVRLLWLAARRDRSTFTCSSDLDYDGLITTELGPATLRRFGEVMSGLGLDLAGYHLIPVHPWQWWNKLSVTFAGEIARRHLVCLGEGDDDHLAQQSIRTFFNVTAPHKHYVKTAISVLNMGFMRGLSAAYMAATPAINDWLAGLIAGDEVLKRTGLSILRERAAIGYHHEQYAAVAPKGSPYLKMLAALWRESPIPFLEPGERPATMAALLHVDRDGRSLAGALIAGSGLSPADWLRRYLDVYLTPLLHCFYAHDLVFMPHGENTILVLDEHGVPRRAFFKDIAEEIVVMNPDAELPEAVTRIRAEVPEDLKALSIFTDVFDCFFRFLSAILDSDGTLGTDDFWSVVAECVIGYQSSVPHLAERFQRYDLFTPEFALSCLNRLQLRDNRQMVDLQDPAGALQLVGTLDNPLAAHAGRAPFRQERQA